MQEAGEGTRATATEFRCLCTVGHPQNAEAPDWRQTEQTKLQISEDGVSKFKFNSTLISHANKEAHGVW